MTPDARRTSNTVVIHRHWTKRAGWHGPVLGGLAFAGMITAFVAGRAGRDEAAVLAAAPPAPVAPASPVAPPDAPSRGPATVVAPVPDAAARPRRQRAPEAHVELVRWKDHEGNTHYVRPDDPRVHAQSNAKSP